MSKKTGAPKDVAMRKAIRKGDVAGVRKLLDAGYEIDQTFESGVMFERDAAGKAALHLATDFGHVEIVRLLINRGANLEVRDRIGQTPLYYAIGGEKASISQLLLAAGAQANVARHGGDTPMHLAVDNGSIKQCTMLVEAGATSFVPDANSVLYSRMYVTPFQRALSDGKKEVVAFLSERCGEDLKQKTLDGRTLDDLVKGDAGMRAMLYTMRIEAAIRQGIGGDDRQRTVPAQRSSDMNML